MKILLIMQLFQIINKTSCKHSHKKQKSTILFICCGYPNYNAEGAFVMIFFICSDLDNCLRNFCTVAIRTENEKKIESPRCKQPFCYFNVFPVRPPQKFKVQAKIPTIQSVFLHYFSVSYNYAVKLQTYVTNEVLYYLSSIKDDVWYCTDTPSAKTSVMNLKTNPATLSTEKKGARIRSKVLKDY